MSINTKTRTRTRKRSKLTKAQRDRWTWLFASAVILALVLWGGISFVSDVSAKRELSHDGVQTSATVTGLDFVGGRSSTYWVNYRFTPPGKATVHRIRLEVPWAWWNSLHVGSKVVVTYDRNNPTTNSPTSQLKRFMPRASWGIEFVIGVAVVGAVGYLIRRVRKAVRGDAVKPKARKRKMSWQRGLLIVLGLIVGVGGGFVAAAILIGQPVVTLLQDWLL